MNTNVGSDHAGDNVSDLSISLFLGRLVIGLGLINHGLKVKYIQDEEGEIQQILPILN